MKNVKFIKMHRKDTIRRENDVINIYCYIPQKWGYFSNKFHNFARFPWNITSPYEMKFNVRYYIFQMRYTKLKSQYLQIITNYYFYIIFPTVLHSRVVLKNEPSAIGNILFSRRGEKISSVRKQMFIKGSTREFLIEVALGKGIRSITTPKNGNWS